MDSALTAVSFHWYKSGTWRLHITWLTCLHSEISTGDVDMSLQQCSKVYQTYVLYEVGRVQEDNTAFSPHVNVGYSDKDSVTSQGANCFKFQDRKERISVLGEVNI